MLAACTNSAQPAQPAESTAPAESEAPAQEDATGSDEAVELTVWYSGGDERIPYFEAIEAEMQNDYPNYTVNLVAYDNETFMTKTLQAATATGGVDLAFNDASRMLILHQQSNQGFVDVSDVLDASAQKDQVTDADLKLSQSGGELIVYPVNRTIAGLGVKTDVEGVDVTADTLPATWDEFIALGESYQAAGMPGFTMHLGTDPGQSFNLLLSGAGMSDLWLNSTPESQIEKNAAYYEDVISIYAGENAFWDKDATSEDFAAMYTKIESGSVGMFRVGNWNAGNWDKEGSGVGEYSTTTYPGIDGSEGGLVVLNTRGFSIPKNSENIEAAKVYLSYALNQAPQEQSFATMGSLLDYSLVDMEALTKNQKIFFDSSVPMYAIDAYVAEFGYYAALNEAYEKGLTNAFSSGSAEEISENVAQLHADVNAAIEDNKE